MSTATEAIHALKEAKKAFRIAQLDPSISNVDKLMQQEKMEQLEDSTFDQFEQMGKSDFIPGQLPPSENGLEEDPLERINIAQTDEEKEKADKEKKEKDAQGKEDDKEKDAAEDEEKEKDAQFKELKNKVAQMEYEKARTKLAQKYGALFTGALKEARINQFNLHKEPIKMLEARINEATNLLEKGGQSLKIAQNEDGLFELGELESTNQSLDMGAKI